MLRSARRGSATLGLAWLGVTRQGKDLPVPLGA